MGPLVTVLLSVYNGEEFLCEAIDSILNQSFTDFEFIIVNDGSFDGTKEILDHYGKIDSRVKAYHQDKRGLEESLNFGISISQGKYIARMDADDICHPERIKTQVVYMESHPEIGLCGSWLKIIGEEQTFIYPCTPSKIRSSMLFFNPIAQSTVILRRSLLVDNGIQYDPNYERCEDYELWSRLSLITQFVNLPEYLLYRRLHPKQLSQQYHKEQLNVADRVRLNLLLRMGFTNTDPGIEVHQAISRWKLPLEKSFYLNAEKWLLALLQHNFEKREYSLTEFVIIIGEYWGRIYNFGKSRGLMRREDFWISPLAICFLYKRLIETRTSK